MTADQPPPTPSAVPYLKRTVDIPLLDGTTLTVPVSAWANLYVGAIEQPPMYTLITVTQNGERKIYATALTWADAVRIWEEAKGRWPR